MSLAHDEYDDHSMEGRKNHGCYIRGWHISGWHLMRWPLQNLYISQIILLLHKILFLSLATWMVWWFGDLCSICRINFI